MVNLKGTRPMGWIPDYPDFRDYTEKTEEVRLTLGSEALSKKKTLPASMDLREWCSPIEDRENLGSCTAMPALESLNITRGTYFLLTFKSVFRNMPHNEPRVRSLMQRYSTASWVGKGGTLC